MATFLFLVSVTATTLLLLAIAADEVSSAARLILGRKRAAHQAIDLEDMRHPEPLIGLSEESLRPSKMPPTRVLTRAVAEDNKGDWDRAA